MTKKKRKTKPTKKAKAKRTRKLQPEVIFDRGIYWNPHVK
jgi:hypothetical protein